MSDVLQTGVDRVYVNGIDVTSYRTAWEVKSPSNDVGKATVTFLRELSQAMSLKTGSIIEIYSGLTSDSLTRDFYGIVTATQDDITGYIVSAQDEMWKASGATFTKLYDITDPSDPFGGDIRLIMIDIAKNANLLMDDTTVDQTAVVVPQVVCDNMKISDKLKELSQVLYWHMYQDPITRKVFVSNPANYPVYPITFETGVNVVESPMYSENINMTVNEVEVQGVRAYTSYVETFAGNNSTTTFTLSRSPIATAVKVTVGGVVKIGAVQGSALKLCCTMST